VGVVWVCFRENIARLLLDFGADASKTCGGRSAMYYAVFNNRIRIIQLLIDLGG
jgi:ankyrin repeat protein